VSGFHPVVIGGQSRWKENNQERGGDGRGCDRKHYRWEVGTGVGSQIGTLEKS